MNNRHTTRWIVSGCALSLSHTSAQIVFQLDWQALTELPGLIAAACVAPLCVSVCRAHWHEPPLSNTSDKDDGMFASGELEDTDRATPFISAHFHITACVSGELYLFDSLSQALQMCDPAMVRWVTLGFHEWKCHPVDVNSRCTDLWLGGGAGELSGCELRSPLCARFVLACESVGQSSRKPLCSVSLRWWKKALILSESERKHQLCTVSI